jgi:hypothetical protein
MARLVDNNDDTRSSAKKRTVEKKGCLSCRQGLKELCYGDLTGVTWKQQERFKAECICNNFKHWEGDR